MKLSNITRPPWLSPKSWIWIGYSGDANKDGYYANVLKVHGNYIEIKDGLNTSTIVYDGDDKCHPESLETPDGTYSGTYRKICMARLDSYNITTAPTILRCSRGSSWYIMDLLGADTQVGDNVRYKPRSMGLSEPMVFGHELKECYYQPNGMPCGVLKHQVADTWVQ